MIVRHALLSALLMCFASGSSAAAEPETGAPSAHPQWTVAGHVGVANGTQTEPSFAWRAGVHRWVSASRSLGLEAGRFRWRGRDNSGVRLPLAGIEPFEGLAKGGNELHMLSAVLRLHGDRIGPSRSAPLFSMGLGLYRQVIRDARFEDARHGRLAPGMSFAVGGAAMRRIAPGAEMRLDLAHTQPGATAYLTVSAAILANH